MKIRTTIAVMAAKITGHVCKLMGRQGVTWAGKRKNICSMRNKRKDHNQ